MVSFLLDEIEPMEMTSRPFRDALAKLLSHQGIVIANVKYGSHYSEVEGESGTAEGVRLEVSKVTAMRSMQMITSIVDKWTDRSWLG
jgi:nucleoside-triphosphatase THEP1